MSKIFLKKDEENDVRSEEVGRRSRSLGAKQNSKRKEGRKEEQDKQSQEWRSRGAGETAVVGGRWSKKGGVRRRRRSSNIRDKDRQYVEKRRSDGVIEEEE